MTQTLVDRDSIYYLLRDISVYPGMDRETATAAIISIRAKQARGLDATDEIKDFLAANMRLVVSIAKPYARKWRMPMDDLIQDGYFGLSAL